MNARYQRSPDSSELASASRTARSAAAGSPASVSAIAVEQREVGGDHAQLQLGEPGASLGHLAARLVVAAGHRHQHRPAAAQR